MRQELKIESHMDQDGNPAGGITTGVGIQIVWQNGPLGRGEDRKAPNGAFVEGVLEAALQRLYVYQTSRFNCRENLAAIIKIEEALIALEQRTRRREAQKTEGTHEGQ